MPVRVLAGDGSWEVLGAGRHRGAYPEQVTPSWDQWGSLQLAFTLQRDPGKPHSDLAAFTPIEYLPYGAGEEPSWGGLIEGTPAAGEDALSVNALGLATLLEFDPYQRTYVYEDLRSWVDTRSLLDPGYSLDVMRHYRANGQVNSTDRGISLVFPQGTVLEAGDRAGVTLDLGPDNGARAWALDWQRIGATHTAPDLEMTLEATNSPFPVFISIGDDDIDLITDSSTDGDGDTGTASKSPVIGLSGPTSYRYLHIYIRITGASTGTGWDTGYTLTGIRAFADTDYFDAGDSGLTATDVMKYALTRAPTLDQATDDLVQTALALRAFGDPLEERTARTDMERANAYHRYLLRLTARGKLQFRPRPARGSLEASTRRAGIDWSDATANSGADVYNRITATGVSGSGRPLRVTRTTTDVGVRNVLDRRGLTRGKTLEVGAPTDETAMALLCTAWLERYGRTPLRGTLVARGAAIRDAKTGRGIRAGYLGARVGELVLLSNLEDPDTGERGRVVALVGVPSYNEETDEAAIALDNTRDDLDAILARMAVVQGP